MNVLHLLDEFRALSREGLNFADNEYDRERYLRMLDLVEDYYGKTFDLPSEEVSERLSSQLGQITPKVASSALLTNDEEKLLMMKRTDTGAWCLPGGAIEIGESPQECAVREVREETGLEIETTELLAVGESKPGSSTPWHTIQHVYRGTVRGGKLNPSDREVITLEYRSIEEVEDWFMNHESLVRDSFEIF